MNSKHFSNGSEKKEWKRTHANTIYLSIITKRGAINVGNKTATRNECENLLGIKMNMNEHQWKCHIITQKGYRETKCFLVASKHCDI